MLDIQFLERDRIDIQKWDNCIDHATSGNPYGLSWYLDNSCKQWSGLVEGDYESVFPLVWNRKLFGIPQLYQPYFCQQLGIYSIRSLKEERIEAFMQAIPRRFRYIGIQLNEGTLVSENLGFSVTKQLNCLLSLKKPYEDLYRNYSQSLKRSLRKAAKNKLSLTDSLKPELLVDLYRTYQGPKISNANEQVYRMALEIMHSALDRDRGFIMGINDQAGKLVGGGFFLSSHNRIINLLPSVTEEGRKLNAMHFMLDSIIRTQAGGEILLDFEGSTVPSIARFFKSFGSVEVCFNYVSRNDLPFWIKWYRS